MLEAELYSSVVQKEKHGLSEASLHSAAKNVGATYNEKALTNGLAYLDYNKPENRCAYIYKYAHIHTAIVLKCFRKLTRKKEVMNILRGKNGIKILCLGGGPGTDIVGIFKALSVYPFMHQRVNRATIMDLCVGWHNSFNYIMQHLINGKIKNIPETFVRHDFEAYFIEANLLEDLSTDAAEAIKNADIVCMVKFVSAVLGNKNSLQALKKITSLFKSGAVILFIDNFNGNVAESIQEISREAGLKIVMGPDVEAFICSSKTNRSTFGCEPLKSARVTVIGFIKTDVLVPSIVNCKDSDDNWETESDTELNSNKQICNKEIEKSDEDSSAIGYCDQFTQTEVNEMSVNLKELSELVDVLEELMAMMVKFKAKVT